MSKKQRVLQCGEWRETDFQQIQESGNCVIWCSRKVFEGNFQENFQEMDLLPQEKIQAERDRRVSFWNHSWVRQGHN